MERALAGWKRIVRHTYSNGHFTKRKEFLTRAEGARLLQLTEKAQEVVLFVSYGYTAERGPELAKDQLLRELAAAATGIRPSAEGCRSDGAHSAVASGRAGDVAIAFVPH
jgi:hypothetical protein